MPGDCGYELEVDESEHRVYLTQWGRLDDNTARALLADLDRKTKALPEGWDLVNDIRDLAPFERQNTAYVQRGKQILADNGAAANARVVDSEVTKMQFERVGESDGEYHVANAETVEQAEAFLDEFRDREA